MMLIVGEAMIMLGPGGNGKSLYLPLNFTVGLKLL